MYSVGADILASYSCPFRRSRCPGSTRCTGIARLGFTIAPVDERTPLVVTMLIEPFLPPVVPAFTIVPLVRAALQLEKNTCP